MFDNLAQTKLFIPPLRPSLVQRPNLLKRLDQGLEPGHKITLVSTPPGFGKTTLLCQWIDRLRWPVGWLSLDEEDNDPDRFLAYFLAATSQIAPEVVSTLPLMEAAPQQPLAVALTELIGKLAGYTEQVILVLDDFHLINESRILENLFSTVQHLPPNLHLVLSSRSDPPWPLARLRGRRELVELRTGDLRFTTEEAGAFLNEVMALELPAADIAALEARTEGWITGLQLASLSMRGKEDRAAFIADFSSSNRFILDYLMEEVLDRQPPALQEFLLKTAILSRLNGPLCDMVLGQENSQVTLAQIEHDNLFLIPLDDERYWFRYHHLLADLLQKKLAQSKGDELPRLHRRASDWCEAAGLFDEAIHHALAGQDFNRAADLVADQANESMRNIRILTLARWLDALPEGHIRQRPWLAVSLAYVLEFYRRAGVERPLLWAEEALVQDLAAPAGAERQKAEAERRHLTGIIAAIRAHNALAFGDIPRTVAQANKALTLLPDDDTQRVETALVLGCAGWAQGDRAAAELAFEAALATSRKLGHQYYQVGSTTYLSSQRAKQGRLREAYEGYAEAVAKAARPSGRLIPIGALPLTKMADLQREWNDLDRATELMDEGLELALQFGHADALCEAYALLARLRLALADEDGAIEAIGLAEQILADNPVDLWIEGWLDESRVRIWLSRGELAAAEQWAVDRGLAADSDLNFHRDLHHINLARLLLAQGAEFRTGPYLGEADRLLGRLLAATGQAGWTHETIMILVLQAVLAWIRGDSAAGTATLAKALALAEPGGYVRTFIDEGRPVRELLRLVAQSGTSTYVGKLLAAMSGADKPVVGAMSSLADPLSERELEVLRLLDSQLSSTKIAGQLFISPNTVRFHMKNIYDKLAVHSRADAVEVARSLNLL